MESKRKYVLKRLRRGAYECQDLLLLRMPWISEKWDGPRESFLKWKVYRAGSPIEGRVLLDGFKTRGNAYRFIARTLDARAGLLPRDF